MATDDLAHVRKGCGHMQQRLAPALTRRCPLVNRGHDPLEKG
ncbi:hypothetical protein [Blastococcus sp. SYSU DS1024]